MITGSHKRTKLLFDNLGNLYLVGLTFSVDFNTTNNALQPSFGGNSDYFIRKWDSDGRLQWSTYLGGSDAEVMFGKVDPFRLTSKNELIILGWTNSNDFPLENEFQSINKGSPVSPDGLNGDMFITKISESGQIMWSSYFGSSDVDFAEIFLDNEENMGQDLYPTLKTWAFCYSIFMSLKPSILTVIAYRNEKAVDLQQ